jgi:hypothetical protein
LSLPTDRPADRLTDRQSVPPRWAIFGLAVVTLLAVSLLLRASSPGRGQPVRAAVRPNSMAVLPFVNTSPDISDNYLGHGIAAGLTQTLDRIPVFGWPRDRRHSG